MSGHGRSYNALKTAYQISEEDRGQPEPQPAEPEYITELDRIEAERAAYAEALQEKVDKGRISVSVRSAPPVDLSAGCYAVCQAAFR